MADIFGIISFDHRNIEREKIAGFRFRDKGFKTFEERLPGGVIFCFGREEDRGRLYAGKTMFVAIYGTAFFNNGRLTSEGAYNLYREYGTDMVRYLKGNFAIIIYENTKKRAILISSRLNTLSLYYHYDGGSFVFSSSVKEIPAVLSRTCRINERSLVERLLFDRTLGDSTYFKDIFQMPPATILKADNAGLKKDRYWVLEKVFGAGKPLSEDKALEGCVDLMRRNLRLYTSDADRFLISLTGGFDSRLNLSLIERGHKDFLCYSYGMPGSKQIEIPTVISKRQGLNYKPVYLDDGFERRYERYALKTIDYSNGTAPITRANFAYAFEQLSGFSRVNITGLFGSEIIKPFFMPNELINRETMCLFTGDNFDKAFDEAILKIRGVGYIRDSVIDRYADEIREYVRENYIGKLKAFDRMRRFYIFTLEEAVRKYFMQEIMIERHYVDTRTPYFDYEFVELIFKTPFAAIHKGVFKRNPLSRRKSQEFYAKIFDKTNPELGKIITDRGYKPEDLLLPTVNKILKLGPLYIADKTRRFIRGNDTFKPLVWSKEMVSKYIYKIGAEDQVFTKKLIEDFESGSYVKEKDRFFSTFSFRLWLDNNLTYQKQEDRHEQISNV